MADYNISAEITADASGFESGIKKAQKASKNLSSTVSNVVKGLGKSGLVGALGAVGLASSGLSATLGTVVKVAKQVSKTIGECTEAYKTQLIAERALNTAIENNPFVTGASADALKQFASEMQKVSNYGDEELIPMMSNLISLGRTEAETMQIMSVAMDMSAGMGISLDTAITQLNATLNGNIGRLGQQNAELKDLTEEELKQGKAVEILGEKFKGLSSATADTSKQLKNIKGDFKEALGQFTLPSSDMWNKFWAGFYERGIQVINKINSYLDAQTIGKKLAGAITEQLKAFGTGDIGGRIDYIRDALKVVTDEELLALQNYLEGLSYISSDQEQILRRIKAETDARKQAVIDQKAQAEASAKQKREEEERLAKLKELEEQEKKNAEERAKALKLQSEWEDKLFAIRLENLEATRDKELENEKLTQEEREAIVDFYGEQILAMKIKQLEKERGEALAQENLTEETKLSINLYYENRITNAKKDEEEKRLKLKKKEVKEEKKEEKSKFETMLEYARQYAKQVASVFKNIVSNVKNIFSKAGNIFMKIIEFNPDEALDNLLKFEDAILTFFVETLPKLPAFFKSAIQSIIVLIDTLLNIIDFDAVTEIVSEIFEAIISALSKWVGSGGWKKLLDFFLKLQQMIENVVADNLPAIVDTIVAMLPDLIDMLIASIVSASRTLAKIAKPIIKLVIELIKAIIEVITSDEVMEAGLDAMMALTEAIFDELLPAIIKLIPTLIVKVIAQVIKNLPKIVKSIIQGLIKAFTNLNWAQVVADCFMGFINAFKDLFGIHSPSTLFEGFGVNMVEGLVNGLQGIANAVNTILEPLYHLIANIFGSIGSTISNSLNSAFTGLNNILNASANIISTIINSLVTLISKANEAVSALNPLSGGSSGGGGGSNIFNDPSNPVNWVDPLGIRHVFGFASGSNAVPKGLAMVGEAGPELVNFRGGEQVLNNRNTNKALAEMGRGTNNFNVTFNNMQDTTAFAMIQQLKNYNRQMAINGIM